MGIFFVYILKSAFCLALFFLFYRLLLSRETFHRFNRAAVLGILLLSLIIPLAEVTADTKMEVQETVLSLEQLLLMGDTAEKVSDMGPVIFSWRHVALFTYTAGIFFFLVRNLYALRRVILLLKKENKKKLPDGTVLIIHHDDKLAPFSWMRYIAISEKDFHENGNEILIHEMAHINNRHSWDLLIAEICVIFQWFNPASWLLKQELQNIHEYEADETVINNGIDAKQYQLLLIKKAVGTRLYSMANSFNHSKLKKRITMMLKEKSNSWARMKYLYVLPLAAMAMTAFARPEISAELNGISTVKVTDLPVIMETVDAETQPDEVKNDPQPINPVITETSERSTAVMALDNVDSDQVTPEIPVTGYTETGTNVSDNEDDPVKETPLILINGEEVSQTILNAIPADRIESMKVLKGRAAEVYGEKGVNGVILIELRDAVPGNLTGRIKMVELAEPLTEFSGKVTDTDGKPVVGASVIIKGTAVATITDLDGNFVIKGPEDRNLIFSHIGMKPIEAKPGKEMKIQLKAD